MEFLAADDESNDVYKLENRINWVIFCHLNILVTSIYTRKQGRGDVFFKEILEAEFRILWKRRRYISTLMESTGYDPTMRKYFREYCEQIERLVQGGEKPELALDRMKSLKWLS